MRQLKIQKSITNRSSEALDKYLVEIGRAPLISIDEEIELAQKIKKGGIIYSLYSKPVIDVYILYQDGKYFSVDNNILVFSTFEKAHNYIKTESIIGYSALKVDIMLPNPSFYIVDEDLNTIRGLKLKCNAITNTILYWRDKMDR